ncbi:uncharacterized protein [Hoplias malabaricus]|uniref:uncharacterized protein n=1 Tax=Hoplias malabaricus TaxID=27720 RepID=UPI003462B844
MSKMSRSMTPMKIPNLPSNFHKKRRKNVSCDKGRGIRKPQGRPFEGRRVYNKGLMTLSAKDPSQDSTSMIMPSGVSSFLLDCMDLDTEAESSFPSIEMVRKADSYEVTGLVTEDEIVHTHVKNSTLLDLSHALDISMQQPPNLSSILELSPEAAKESFCLSPPQPVSSPGSTFRSSPLVELRSASSSSSAAKNIAGSDDLNVFGAVERTPENKRVVVLSPVVKRRPLVGRNKPIKCRKVVTFNDIVSTRDITVLEALVEPQNQACDVQKNKLEGPKKEGMDPQELSSEPAKLFAFADEEEKKMFFQSLKKTYTFQFPANPIIFNDLSLAEDDKR